MNNFHMQMGSHYASMEVILCSRCRQPNSNGCPFLWAAKERVEMEKEKQGNWFQRHKILTVVIAFIFIVAIASSASDNENNQSSQQDTDTQTSQSVEEKTDQGEASKPNRDDLDSDEPLPEPKEVVSVSKTNAANKAKSYLRLSGFSRDGLIDQLEYDQFSNEDATYGADNSGADWNEQAVKKAKSYMSISSFSRDGLVNQLVYSKFTQEQAEHGANAVGL